MPMDDLAIGGQTTSWKVAKDGNHFIPAHAFPNPVKVPLRNSAPPGAD
jgi:hypothetical protein